MSVISDLRLTPINIARYTAFVCGHVIVELHTDDGLRGIGEMSDLQHLPRFHPDIADLASTLYEMLVGTDIWDSNRLTGLLTDAFPPAGALYDKGAVIRCGVDLALWDLRGKATGRSLSSLLGGAVRESLPVAYPIFRQRTQADLDSNLDLVEERLASGFSMFRVYVGGDLDLDEEFLRRLRERFAERIQIKSLDFSNLLDAPAATRFIERTRDVGYALVEAPAYEGDVTGLAEVRRRTLIPVSEHVYDARSALRLAAERAVDVFNVGLFALGGITGAQQVIAVAEAARIHTLIGTTQELSIGTAAAAHLGVSTVSAQVAADPVGPLLYQGDVVTEPVTYRDGHLLTPAGPGLGMNLDPQRLQEAAGPLRWQAGSGSVIDRVGTPA